MSEETHVLRRDTLALLRGGHLTLGHLAADLQVDEVQLRPIVEELVQADEVGATYLEHRGSPLVFYRARR